MKKFIIKTRTAPLLAAVFIFAALCGLGMFALVPGTSAAEASTAHIYSVTNVTTSKTFGVNTLNNTARAAMNSVANVITVYEQEVMGSYIPLHTNATNSRRVVWVGPDAQGVLRVLANGTAGGATAPAGFSWQYRDPMTMWGLTAAQLEAEGMTRAPNNYFSSVAVNNGGNVLTIQIPAGGFLMVGHGFGAIQLTEDFEIGDEVVLNNNSPFRLINTTPKWGMRHDLNLRGKNREVISYNSVIWTSTASHKSAVIQEPWRAYIRAEWDAAANGYVVDLVTSYNPSTGVRQPFVGRIAMPQNGFIVESHDSGLNTRIGQHASSNIMFLTEVGDVFTFEDNTVYLPESDITAVSGSATFEMDGANPMEAAAVEGKSVIYTNAFSKTQSFLRGKDANFVEYVVGIEDGIHTVVQKNINISRTFIPLNGYVLSIPSSVAGYNSLSVGDTVTLSGTDSQISRIRFAVDNMTQGIRVPIYGKNTFSRRNQAILYTDMPGNVTNPGFFSEVIVTPGGGGSLVSSVPRDTYAQGRTTIPANGFVLSGHGILAEAVASFAANDVIVLYDETDKSAAVTVTAGAVSITAEIGNPYNDTPIAGKVVIYTASSGTILSKVRSGAAFEIAVRRTVNGHFVERVFDGSGNPIPNHGYLLSVPGTAPNLAAIRAAFTAGTEVTFSDDSLFKLDFTRRVLDNPARNLRLEINKENADYTGGEAVLFNDTNFLSVEAGGVRGRTPVNAFAWDIVVVNSAVTQIRSGGGTVIPSNGFIIGAHGPNSYLARLFATGDAVVLNDFVADNDISLRGISLGGTILSGFRSEQFNYIVHLAPGAGIPTVTWTRGRDGQSVSITNATAIPGATVIRVTSANREVTAEYTLNFRLNRNTNSNLASIAVGGVNLAGFSAVLRDYTVFLEGGATAYPIVSAVAATPLARITIEQADFAAGRNTAKITVVAEDDFFQSVYVITFLPAADTGLTGITVGGTTIADFDAAQVKYTVEIERGAAVPVVAATASSSSAVVSVIQAGGARDTAVITVTDGGHTRTYQVQFVISGTGTGGDGCGNSSVSAALLLGLLIPLAVIFFRRRKV